MKLSISSYLFRFCFYRYAWEDIGALFWPRYIRRGECSTDLGSCSWPSGMHCVPSETANIEILRWQCRARKGRGRKKGYKALNIKDYDEEEKPVHLKCGWIRVPYPITTECMCTCWVFDSNKGQICNMYLYRSQWTDTLNELWIFLWFWSVA